MVPVEEDDVEVGQEDDVFLTKRVIFLERDIVYDLLMWVTDWNRRYSNRRNCDFAQD